MRLVELLVCISADMMYFLCSILGKCFQYSHESIKPRKSIWDILQKGLLICFFPAPGCVKDINIKNDATFSLATRRISNCGASVATTVLHFYRKLFRITPERLAWPKKTIEVAVYRKSQFITFLIS